jgi:hypothetical protein
MPVEQTRILYGSLIITGITIIITTITTLIIVTIHHPNQPRLTLSGVTHRPRG